VVFGELARVGAFLGVYSAIVTPSPVLAASTPEQRVLDLGNVPGETTQLGEFKDCSKIALESVTTNMDITPAYSWPNNNGESFLTKAGINLEFNFDPVADYIVTPNKVSDSESEKLCSGTRTEEIKIRVKAEGKLASRRIFNQIIRGNDTAGVGASFNVPVGKACRAKDAPKTVKISRTQTTKYREEDRASQRKRTVTRTIPCLSRDFVAVPSQG